MDGRWWINSPAPLLLLPCLSDPQQDRAQVVLSISILDNAPFQLPSLPVFFPCWLPVLPGSTSKMSYQHSYLCLQACLGDNPTQDSHHVRQWLYISIASDRNPNRNWLKQKKDLLAPVIEQSRLIAPASGTIESITLNDVTSTWFLSFHLSALLSSALTSFSGRRAFQEFTQSQGKVWRKKEHLLPGNSSQVLT